MFLVLSKTKIGFQNYHRRRYGNMDGVLDQIFYKDNVQNAYIHQPVMFFVPLLLTNSPLSVHSYFNTSGYLILYHSVLNPEQ